MAHYVYISRSELHIKGKWDVLLMEPPQWKEKVQFITIYTVNPVKILQKLLYRIVQDLTELFC